jgi:pimeloyl-ACP methyl ester carboxylesterase
MRWTAKIGYAPFLALLLAGFVLSCDDDNGDLGNTAVPRFESTACQHTLVEGSPTECGYLVVPENREDVNSKTIRLYITIFKSDSNGTSNEPVLYLTGGPGAETAFAIEAFENPTFFRSGFGGNRDIIVVDQRGTNRSLPALYCSQELGPVASDVYGMDFHEAANQRVALLLDCQDRLVSQGIDLSGYDTVENASDIRDLVTVLGLGRVNLYCASYGTRLCFFIMRQSPQIIKAVILDSVLPPELNPFEAEVDGTLFAFNALYEAAAVQYPELQSRVEQISARLQANPVNVISSPAMLSAFERSINTQFPQIMTRLRANPASDLFRRTQVRQAGPVTVSVDGVKFASYVRGRLSQTPYDSALPMKIYQMFEDGNYQEVADDWVGNVNFFWPSGGPGSTAPSLGMYNSVFAANDSFRTTAGRISLLVHNAIDDEGLAEWYLTNFIFMEPGVLHLWEVEPLPDSVRAPVASNLPILMLVGALDSLTPQIFSQPSADLLPNSFYFVIRAGHATAFLECVVDMIHAFLLDPSTAPNDGCPQTFTWD